MVPRKNRTECDFFVVKLETTIEIIMLQLTTVIFLISLSLLAVLHVISLKLFLYWRFWWLDIPMHLFGGAIVALGVYTLYDLRLFVPKRYLQLLPLLLIVFAVSLSWEVYELFIGIPIEDSFVPDTITDLSMGLIGGAIGYSIGKSLRKL